MRQPVQAPALTVSGEIAETSPGAPCTPGVDLLADKQHQRWQALFAGDEHIEVEATWGLCQATLEPAGVPDQGPLPSARPQLVAMWPAVNGYCFLPIYDTIIAAGSFDRRAMPCRSVAFRGDDVHTQAGAFRRLKP